MSLASEVCHQVCREHLTDVSMQEMMAHLFRKGSHLNHPPRENPELENVGSQERKSNNIKKGRNRRLCLVPKGRKRLCLKLRRGERPGLCSQRRKRERFQHKIKRKGKDKLKDRRGERAKIKSERRKKYSVLAQSLLNRKQDNSLKS